MNERDIETYLDLAAAQIDLTIDPAWRQEVIGYYRLSMRMAATLEEHRLAIGDEPAPVFSA